MSNKNTNMNSQYTYVHERRTTNEPTADHSLTTKDLASRNQNYAFFSRMKNAFSIIANTVALIRIRKNAGKEKKVILHYLALTVWSY
jgi:hypothetical protein